MRVVLFGIGPLALGFVLDLILGDPPWLYHPVRGMGLLIAKLEDWLRKSNADTPAGKRAAGMQMALMALVITLAAYGGIIALADLLGDALGILVRSFLCYQLIAVKDLYSHGNRVLRRLEEDDLPGAQKALSRIVGRDTQPLDEAGVIRATVESVAENTADGVVAPLFYITLGGPVLGALYKMINTMDSMVGYKNRLYLDFGRFAARLDDFAGWLPARLAALCMVAAAALCEQDAKNAWRIWRRDRRAHASPNSGQTEAACAGALGIRLGGPSYYDGVMVDKPMIGDDDRPPRKADIESVGSMMLAVSFMVMLLCLVLRTLLLMVFF